MARFVRVGVTGSTGFIGTSLVEALTRRGDEVIRFVRPSSKVAPSAATIRWRPDEGVIDVSDLERVGALDAIVHLAGTGVGDRRWTKERQREIRESRLNSTRSLVSAISSKSLRCAHLVSASAIGYYGSRSDEVLDENSTPGVGFLASVCVDWETAASSFSDHSVPVALLRTGIVLSAKGGALKKQLPMFRAGIGGPLGNGQQWMSPISLADQLRAIQFILDQRLDGAYNLTCPNPLTNADFTRQLARIMHRPAAMAVPRRVLGAVLGSQLVDEVVLASQRVVPSALVERGFEFRSPDASSALSSALND